MIRRARVSDIPELVVLGIEFHALASPHIPYDHRSTTRFLTEMVANLDAGLFVIEREQRVVGAAGALVAPAFFNFHHKFASELFWFVSEDARGGTDAMRLFKALESWAKARGATTLTMTALAANQEVGAVYQRRGYSLQEVDYVKEL